MKSGKEVTSRNYCLVAFKASCSLVLSSCERDVLRTLPPVPLISSSTLSGVARLPRKKRTELPGCMVSAGSFINLSSMPEVPSADNRRALLERGDVDVSFDLPPRDWPRAERSESPAYPSKTHSGTWA